MKGQKLLTMLLALLLAGFMANCDGGNGEEDGDAEEDVQIDDVRVDEVRPDDVPVEDVQPEEIAPDDVPTEDVVTDDVVEDDVVVDDVPAEELPACVSGTLTCTSDLTGETTVGATDSLNDYSCSTYDESGGDKTYTFTSTEDRMVTIDMTTGGEDLDLYVLSGACDPATCIAYSTAISTEHLTFRADAGVTYYVTVDGYDEAEDTYDIEVSCAVPEVCDNGTDDNGNLLIDCSDADCAEAANCFESSCTDDVDNDGNGLTDCADLGCFGSADCAGGPGEVGATCSIGSDCAGGTCIDEPYFGWAGGYCTTLSYAEDCTTLACPTGSTCVQLGTFGPWGCLKDCTTVTDCRAGYDCTDTGSGTQCLANCTDNVQCTQTNYCDVANGWCAWPPEACTGGVDDDHNTLTDCGDPICGHDVACTITTLAGGETCAAAVALTVPAGERGSIMVNGTTTGAADDFSPSCAGTGALDVVYSLTIAAPARVTAWVYGGTASPLATETVLAISSDCTAGDILCNDAYLVYEQARIIANLAAGTYYIIVDGYETTVGAGDFTLLVILEDVP